MVLWEMTTPTVFPEKKKLYIYLYIGCILDFNVDASLYKL